jgi:hypothetical protein
VDGVFFLPSSLFPHHLLVLFVCGKSIHL